MGYEKTDGIRIMAEWCYKWEPREDGEFYVDDQCYAVEECDSVKEAALYAQDNDLHEEGRVIIEQWQLVDEEFGLYDWQEIDEFQVWEVLKTTQSTDKSA